MTSLLFDDLELTEYPYWVDGVDASWGNPQPVTSTMSSLLADGALTRLDHYENREAFLRVRVSGADPVELAQNIAELTKRTGLRTTLRWAFADLLWPTTVLMVETSYLEHTFDNYDESQRLEATYGLRLVCLPFARSVDAVTTSLTAVANATSTQVDAASDATAWTASATTAASAVTVDSSTFYEGTSSLTATETGPLRTYDNPGDSGYIGVLSQMRFVRPGTIVLGTDTVVTVMWNPPSWAGNVFFYMVASNSADGSVNEQYTATLREVMENGWRRATFDVPAGGTLSNVTFWASASGVFPTGTQPTTAKWRIDDIRRATPGTATARQFVGTPAVPGSMRSSGTVRVAHDTSALGDVLVSTWDDYEDGFAPNCSRFAVSGIAVSATSVSGKSFQKADVPLSTLRPGAYLILAQSVGVGAISAAPAVLKLSTRVGGVEQTPVLSLSTGDTSLFTGTTVRSYGVAHLPPVRASRQGDAVLRVDTTTSTTDVGEVWLFRLEDGAITWVDATGLTKVFLEQPSVSEPYGAVWVGNQADMSDARHPAANLRLLGRHKLAPAGSGCLVAATNAPGVTADLIGYPTWHTMAAS